MVHETRHLCIGNLTQNLSEQELHDLYKIHGKIEKIKFNKNKSQAIITFSDVDTATKALNSSLNLDGRLLTTNYDDTQSPKNGVKSKCSSSFKTNNNNNKHKKKKKSRTSSNNSSSKSHDELDELVSLKSELTSSTTNTTTTTTTSSSSSSSLSSPSSSISSSSTSTSSLIHGESMHTNVSFKSIKITNLPSRSKIPNIKETLYDEFIKYGRITHMSLEGESERRVVLIYFKKRRDAQRALAHSKEIHVASIKIERHIDSMYYDTQYVDDDQLDECSYKATRTLYIGNLDRDVSTSDLRERLMRKKYEDIIDIEIKKDPNKPHTQNSYAFIQFCSIKTVVKAIICLEPKYFGSSLIKLGFGKSKPTRCLWIDRISDECLEKKRRKYFSQVKHVLFSRVDKHQALLFFDSIQHASQCADTVRGLKLLNDRLMVDFASNKEISLCNHMDSAHDCIENELIDDYLYYNQYILNNQHTARSSSSSSSCSSHSSTSQSSTIRSRNSSNSVSSNHITKKHKKKQTNAKLKATNDLNTNESTASFATTKKPKKSTQISNTKKRMDRVRSTSSQHNKTHTHKIDHMSDISSFNNNNNNNNQRRSNNLLRHNYETNHNHNRTRNDYYNNSSSTSYSRQQQQQQQPSHISSYLSTSHQNYSSNTSPYRKHAPPTSSSTSSSSSTTLQAPLTQSPLLLPSSHTSSRPTSSNSNKHATQINTKKINNKSGKLHKNNSINIKKNSRSSSYSSTSSRTSRSTTANSSSTTKSNASSISNSSTTSIHSKHKTRKSRSKCKKKNSNEKMPSIQHTNENASNNTINIVNNNNISENANEKYINKNNNLNNKLQTLVRDDQIVDEESMKINNTNNVQLTTENSLKQTTPNESINEKSMNEDLTSKIEKFKQNNLSTFKKCFETNNFEFDLSNELSTKKDDTLVAQVSQLTKINIEKAKQQQTNTVASSTKIKSVNIPLESCSDYEGVDPRVVIHDQKIFLFKCVSYHQDDAANSVKLKVTSASNSPSRPKQTKSSPSHSRSPSNSSSSSQLNSNKTQFDNDIDTVDERIRRLDELLHRHEKNQLPKTSVVNNFSSPPAPLTSFSSLKSSSISSPSPQTPSTHKTPFLSTKIFELDEKRLNTLAQSQLTTNRLVTSLSPSCSSMASSSLSHDQTSAYNLIKVNQSPVLTNKSQEAQLTINTNHTLPKEPDITPILSPTLSTSPQAQQENTKQIAEKLGLKIKAPPSKLNINTHEITTSEESPKVAEPLTPQVTKTSTQSHVIKRTFSCTEQQVSSDSTKPQIELNTMTNQSSIKKPKLEGESSSAAVVTNTPLKTEVVKEIVTKIEPAKSEEKQPLSKIPKIKPPTTTSSTVSISSTPSSSAPSSTAPSSAAPSSAAPSLAAPSSGTPSSAISKKSANISSVKKEDSLKIVKPSSSLTTLTKNTHPPKKPTESVTKVVSRPVQKHEKISSNKNVCEIKVQNDSKKKITTENAIKNKDEPHKVYTKDKESLDKKTNDVSAIKSKASSDKPKSDKAIVNSNETKKNAVCSKAKSNALFDLYDSEDSDHTVKSSSTTNTDNLTKNKSKDASKLINIKSTTESKIPVRKESKENVRTTIKENDKKVDCKKDIKKANESKVNHSNLAEKESKNARVNGKNEKPSDKQNQISIKNRAEKSSNLKPCLSPIQHASSNKNKIESSDDDKSDMKSESEKSDDENKTSDESSEKSDTNSNDSGSKQTSKIKTKNVDKKKIKKQKGISREVYNLFDNLHSGTLSTSMYDRVKARPRCDSVKRKRSQKRNGKSKKSSRRSNDEDKSSSSHDSSESSNNEEEEEEEEDDENVNNEEEEVEKDLEKKSASENEASDHDSKKSKKNTHSSSKKKQPKKPKSDVSTELSDDESLSDMDEEKREQLFKQFLKERRANRNVQRNRKRHQSNSSLFDSEESGEKKQKTTKTKSNEQIDERKKLKMANKKLKIDEPLNERDIDMESLKAKSDDEDSLQAQTIGSLQDSLFKTCKKSKKEEKIKIKREKKLDDALSMVEESKENLVVAEEQQTCTSDALTHEQETLIDTELKEETNEVHQIKEEVPLIVESQKHVEDTLNKELYAMDTHTVELVTDEKSKEAETASTETCEVENKKESKEIPVISSDVEMLESSQEKRDDTEQIKAKSPVPRSQLSPNEEIQTQTSLTQNDESKIVTLESVIVKNELVENEVKKQEQQETAIEGQAFQVEQQQEQINIEHISQQIVKVEQIQKENEINSTRQSPVLQQQALEQNQVLFNNNNQNNHYFDVLIEAIQLNQPPPPQPSLNKLKQNEQLDTKQIDQNNININSNKLDQFKTNLTPSTTPLPTPQFIPNYINNNHHHHPHQNTQHQFPLIDPQQEQLRIKNIHADLSNSVHKLHHSNHELEAQFAHFTQQQQQQQPQLHHSYQQPSIKQSQEQPASCQIQFSQPTPPPSSQSSLHVNHHKSSKTPTPTNTMEKLIFDQIQQQQQPLKINKSQQPIPSHMPATPYGMPFLLNQPKLEQMAKQQQQQQHQQPPTKSPLIPAFYSLDPQQHQQQQQQQHQNFLAANPLFFDNANPWQAAEVFAKYPFLSPQANSHLVHKSQQQLPLTPHHLHNQQQHQQMQILQTSPKIVKQEQSKTQQQQQQQLQQQQQQQSNIINSNQQFKVVSTSHKRSATPKEMAKELAAKPQQQQQDTKIQLNHQSQQQPPHSFYQGLLEQNPEFLRVPYAPSSVSSVAAAPPPPVPTSNPGEFRLPEISYPSSLFMSRFTPESFPHVPHPSVHVPAHEYMNQMMSQMHQSPFNLSPHVPQPQLNPHLPHQQQQQSQQQQQIINHNPQETHSLSTIDHVLDLGRSIWTSSFVLKNDCVTVSMNFVFGNVEIAKSCLTQMNIDGLNMPIRITQRMRLEQNQMEGVQKKLQVDNEHCVLIALPYGTNNIEQINQSNCLRTGFINYLQEKKAAGIVNVTIPGPSNASYVVHIFPPCQFSNDTLKYRAPDVARRITEQTAHLFIVIATV